MRILRRICWILAVTTWILAVLSGVTNVLAAKTELDVWIGAWTSNYYLWYFGTQALMLLCGGLLIAELVEAESGQRKWPIVRRYLPLIGISALLAIPMLTVFQNLAAFS